MGRPTTAAPLLLMFAAACGGTVVGNPGGAALEVTNETRTQREVLTGVLAGNIAGLHFRTQMLEGLTDKAGGFIYYAGETVSFHLGDIALGEALAAPRLDLFAIAGTSPPATEHELIDAVLDSSTVGPFDRAANAAMVLLAFDRDDDATNGIEVGGLDLALTGKRLELAREHGEFLEDLGAYAQRAALSLNAIEPADAIAYIYDAIDLRIAAHARRVTFRDNNLADPSDDVVTTVTFDEAGRVSTTSDLFTTPNVADTQTVYVRDHRGRETRRETVSTYDPTLALPSRTFVVQTDRDVYGQPMLSVETTLEGAALRYSRTDERSRDPAGRLLSSQTLTDYDGDASTDEEQRRTYGYERDSVRYEESYSSQTSGSYRANAVATFGAGGRIISRRETTDGNSDGIVDSEYQVDYVHDTRGLVMSSAEQYRSSATAPLSRTTTTYMRDGAGRVVRSDMSYDGGAMRSTQEIFYDANHRIIGTITTDEGSAGNLVRRVVEMQRDAAGNIVSREARILNRASAAGQELLTARVLFSQTFEGGVPVLQESREDTDGDGTFDSQVSRRFEYVMIPNGAHYIVANARQWTE